MKKFFALFVFGSLTLQESYAAAARDDSLSPSSAVVARVAAFSQENLIDLCVLHGPYQGTEEGKKLLYKNLFAEFKQNLKSLNWDRSASQDYFITLTSALSVSLNSFTVQVYSNGQEGHISRSIIQKIYPQRVEPIVIFLQETFFNPLMKKFRDIKTISPESTFGVLLGKKFALGYIEDIKNSYIFMPFQPTPYINKIDVFIGRGNLESQSCFLMSKETLITDPGFIIDRRRDGSGLVRITQYYGGDPERPLKTFPKAICGAPSLHPVFADLDILLNKERNTIHSPNPTIFIAMPRTNTENDLLELLILAEVSKEQDPEIQRENLRLLQAYGYFEERSPLQTNHLAILPEDFPQDTPAAAASAEETRPASSIPEKPYVQIIEDLTQQAKDRLEQKIREEIRAEQEIIRQRVISEASSAPVERAPSTKAKKKRQPKSATAGQTLPRSEAAATSAQETEEAITRRVQDLMTQYRLKGLEKFRNLQRVINAFIKDKAKSLIAERRRGSHHAISIPEMGSITIAHHGANDVVPTVSILKDFVRTLGSTRPPA